MDQARWVKAKRLVIARDGNKCLRCFGEAEVVHHRIPRGMGGSGDEERNYGLANLVALCNPCHAWAHENPDEAYEAGFLLRSWETPEKRPLAVKPGTFYVTLTKDGNMEITRPLMLF